MVKDKFGQLIYDDEDLCDILMENPNATLYGPSDILLVADLNQTIQEFDKWHQEHWLMPTKYYEMDIAVHVLNLCKDEVELQRCGHELLLYQERGLFNLLKYLCYLVDVMKENKIIYGVGRGSSVASFVLYKLGVHRIDSLFYNLQVEEFLR